MPRAAFRYYRCWRNSHPRIKELCRIQGGHPVGYHPTRDEYLSVTQKRSGVILARRNQVIAYEAERLRNWIIEFCNGGCASRIGSPAMRTCPFGSNVAVWNWRGSFKLLPL